MHKCTSLAIHDDTGIAKLLFILTSNGATDRDSVYSCIIYFTIFYLYICGVILPAFMLLCMYCALIRMLYFVRKWRNKTDQSLQVSTRWALQKWNGEQNISWVSDVYWVSTRWAFGEYWQRCLRRCALGEYCTCLEVCTRWALDLNSLCRWILDEYCT